MTTVANRVIRNTFYLYGKIAVTTLISFYSTRIILQALGVIDYGIFNIVAGVIALFGFLSASLASVSQRFISLSLGKNDLNFQKTTFSTTFTLHLCLAILICVMLVIASMFLFNGILNIPENRIHAAKWVYGTLVVGAMFSIMIVPLHAILNAHENMLYFSLLDILDSVLKLLAALYVSHHLGDKLMLYAVLFVLITVTNYVVGWLYCTRYYAECKLSLKKYFSKDILKDVSKFTSWTLLTVTCSMGAQYGMGLIMNFYFGAALNAAQGIATQLSGQLCTFSSNMQKAITPVIVKSHGAGNTSSMVVYALKSCKFSFLMLSFVGVPVGIEAPYICKLWLVEPPKWAALFVQLEICRHMVEQISVSCIATIEAVGKIKVFNIVKSVIRCLPLVFCLIMMQISETPYLIYITWIVFALVCTSWHIFCAAKACNFTFSHFWRETLLPSFIVLVSMCFGGIITTATMEPSILRVALTFIITSMIFAIATYLTLDMQEKNKIKTFFKRTTP